MLKAVIFDLDGVIIDSESAHFCAFDMVMRRFNVRITRKFYKRYFGYGALYIMKDLFKRHKVKEDPVFWTKMKDVYYRGIARKKLKPFPDAIKLIKKLHRHFKIAIASSAVDENIRQAMKMLKIERYISIFVSSEHVKHAKPWPDIYIEAAKRLKLEPEECIVIEDAVAGIEAAKKAGMKCIAVTNTVGKEKLKDADIVVKSLDSISTDRTRSI